MADSKTDRPSGGGERIDKLYDRLAGGYMYSGNGEWSHIKDVRKVDNDIVFQTDSVRYDTVPQPTRQEAYDIYDDNGTVIVHPDGIDVSEMVST